jgi:hypothetical protein
MVRFMQQGDRFAALALQRDSRLPDEDGVWIWSVSDNGPSLSD